MACPETGLTRGWSGRGGPRRSPLAFGSDKTTGKKEEMTSPDDPLHLERLSILDTPDRHDVQFLDDRLYEYNVAGTGIADGRLLAIILRDRHNDIIAGLYGWTWGSCCEVKTLWVHEQWRGQGGHAPHDGSRRRSSHARGSPNGVVDA